MLNIKRKYQQKKDIKQLNEQWIIFYNNKKYYIKDDVQLFILFIDCLDCTSRDLFAYMINKKILYKYEVFTSDRLIDFIDQYNITYYTKKSFRNIIELMYNTLGEFSYVPISLFILKSSKDIEWEEDYYINNEGYRVRLGILKEVIKDNNDFINIINTMDQLNNEGEFSYE